eukprot:TRINITY_DN14044_c0_g1_i2.p1 TRINITY_DN14044_c0_g1~~TRINITY_DN14044_c0_g1_i2.p1  ORF type:complete len:300 (-),score=90.60 TRINITY_DN14044_c0_g1_i2:467-1366(-)
MSSVLRSATPVRTIPGAVTPPMPLSAMPTTIIGAAPPTQPYSGPVRMVSMPTAPVATAATVVQAPGTVFPGTRQSFAMTGAPASVVVPAPMPMAAAPGALLSRQVSAPAVVAAPALADIGQQTAAQDLAIVMPPAPPLPTMAVAPMNMTEGFPDLESIANQRNAHLASLEQQEKQTMESLDQQRQEQCKAIRSQGDAKKAAYNLEIERQIQQFDLALNQQLSEHMMVLNQQYTKQRGLLEQQANALVMEYQHKKAHEDMMMQQYTLQRQMHDSQQRYAEEMTRIQSSVPTGSVVVRPAA